MWVSPTSHSAENRRPWNSSPPPRRFTPTLGSRRSITQNILTDMGNYRAAIKVFDHAWKLPHEPNSFADVAARYALCMDKLGRSREACTMFEEALSTDPKIILLSLEKMDLIGLGYGEEIFQTWKRALKSRQSDAAAYDGYAELALFLGHDEEYLSIRSLLLSRFSNLSEPRMNEHIGRACLLLPDSDEHQHAAANIVQRCVIGDKSKFPIAIQSYFHFSQGLAEYRLGELPAIGHHPAWRRRQSIGSGPRARGGDG